MSSHRLITKSLTIGLAAAALGAPAALAGPPQGPVHLTPLEQQVLASRGQGAPDPIRGPVTYVAAPKAQPADNSGFDLGSAAIGAGVAGGVALLAFGAFGLADHRRVRVAR